MSIEVICTECSAKQRVEDAAAGQRLACNQCGRALSATVSPPLAPFGKRLFAFVFSLAPHAVMLFVLLPFGFEPIWESVRAGSWPQVEGVITKSDVHTSYTSKGARSNVVVSYRYEVNSATYTGKRICVMGHSNKTFENVHDVAARYPVDAKVKVFYDPLDPAAAVLVPGTSGLMWFTVLIAVGMWINLANFTRLTFLALIGKPVAPKAPGTSPLGRWIAGTGLVTLAVIFGGMILMLGSGFIRNFHWPRDGEEWLMAGFAIFMFGLLCAFMAFLLMLIVNVLKPAPTVDELRADPTTPWFSSNSIVCLTRGVGLVAAIVDRDAQVIHFKKCFRPLQQPFLSWPSAAWWSCSLDAITGLSQQTFKGATTFIIETADGKAWISSVAINCAELREYLENRPLEQAQHVASTTAPVEQRKRLQDSDPNPNETEDVPNHKPSDRRSTEAPRPMPVKTEYLPGQKPLDGRASMCVIGACCGPFVLMLFGVRDVGSCFFWGCLLGGCSGLPFDGTTPRKLGRFVASEAGMRLIGGLIGLLVFFVLKLFIQTRFLDLLVLAGAGTLLGHVFASQRAKWSYRSVEKPDE